MSEAQKKAQPPVAHPVVRIHPETGRKCLFLGDHAWCIEGMELEEGRALIEELNASIVKPELVYTHRWRPGDLVVWDNRCMLHKAEPYDVRKGSARAAPLHGGRRGADLTIKPQQAPCAGMRGRLRC